MGQARRPRTVAASGPTSYPSVRRVPSGSRVRRCNAPRFRASFITWLSKRSEGHLRF